MGETTEGSEENVEVSWNYGEIKKTVNSWVKLRRNQGNGELMGWTTEKRQQNGELMG